MRTSLLISSDTSKLLGPKYVTYDFKSSAEDKWGAAVNFNRVASEWRISRIQPKEQFSVKGVQKDWRLISINGVQCNAENEADLKLVLKQGEACTIKFEAVNTLVNELQFAWRRKDEELFFYLIVRRLFGADKLKLAIAEGIIKCVFSDDVTATSISAMIWSYLQVTDYDILDINELLLDERTKSLLMCAAQANFLRVAEALLRIPSINTNIRSRGKRLTSLDFAVQNDSIDVAKCIIKKCNIPMQTRMDCFERTQNPEMLCVLEGECSTVKFVRDMPTGIQFSERTVRTVDPKSEAHSLGIRPGWRVVLLNGSKFSRTQWRREVDKSASFQATFSKEGASLVFQSTPEKESVDKQLSIIIVDDNEKPRTTFSCFCTYCE